MKGDNETILILGGLAVGGYLIYKSQIAQNIGEVGSGIGAAVGGLGEGLGTAGQGLGSGIASVGYSAGSIAESIASPFEFLKLGIDLGQSSLRREYSQRDFIDVGAFEQSAETLTTLQAEKEVFAAEQGTLRSNIRQTALTNVNKAIFTAPSKADVLKAVFPLPTLVLGGVDKAFAYFKKSDESRALTAEPATGGSVTLPTSSKTSSVRSTGSSSSSSSSSPKITTAAQLKSYVSGGSSAFSSASSSTKTSTSPKTSSLKTKITSTFNAGVSKAKSLLSSIASKIRR